MTRAQRRRHETKEEIKDAARLLLAEGGHDAVSLRAIARKIGMTAPALYRYYKSHQHIIDELATEMLPTLRTAVQRAEWSHVLRDEQYSRALQLVLESSDPVSMLDKVEAIPV